MSDDDFGDDSFFVDDSFLQEVDNIAASAQSFPQNNGFNRSVSLGGPPQAPKPAQPASRGWTGVQRSFSGPSTRSLTKITSVPKLPTSGSSSHRSSIFAKKQAPSPAHPSSDDYDTLPLPAESIAALDSLNNLGAPQLTSSSSSRPSSGQVIPSSRLGLGRAANGSSGFLQTHLNFRREKQSTKGKRWDRTEFAETGRRVGAEKGKGKAKGKRKSRDWEDEDEEDLFDEEDDWVGALAPAPPPLVDMNAPYEPQRHLPNSATINTYIYPTNRPKRDYQYEIVKACFADNCLVALPTGLGKTFVAGVVMLNFYRWFPTGKIVFLAPTRPLVNQQIEACQLSCGIPSKDAAVMTGQSVSAKERTRLWEDRRVFYCTPQTLDNDLKKGAVDPRDIVLAVFDEAHKASGSYAYTTILAYITAHHPYFRVLALTATPGADVPRVQAVVDALHISRIEIREAEAPEIRKYMNEKHTERHIVPMSDVIENFRDRWAALMRPHVAKLVEKDILNDRDLDCKRLRPFRLTAKRMEIARDRNSGLKWAFGSLTALEKMARAMGNLLEFSLGMFHTSLVEIAGGMDSAGKKSNTKGSANSMRNNTEFQKLLRDVEVEMNMIRIGKDGRSKADKHPKMQQTLDLLLAHFSQAEEEETTLGQKNDTRAMVFCSYRACVLDIVEMLNQHSGLLRATKFVGQSAGKGEDDKGFNQKEQKKTINEFKDGKYNILVSTSIGEEGLDIGEVDFVVIYDMPKQSIKLLQRIGRTGRKRDGKVHVLMSENREDTNWETAQQTHRDIQEEILHSRNLELFEDVEPLVPISPSPECIEQEMEIDPWDPTDQKYGKALAEAEKIARKQREKQAGKTRTKGEASKKGKGRGHEVPEGADGFKSVADLLRGAGKLGKSPRHFSDEDDEDSSDRPVTKAKGRSRTSSTTAGRRKRKEPSPICSESDEEEEANEDLEAFFAKTDGRSAKAKSTVANAKKRARQKSPVKPHNKAQDETRSKSKRSSLKDIDVNPIPGGDSDISSSLKKGPISRKSKSVSAKEKAEELSRKEQALRDKELEQSALDFFNTQGHLRRRGESMSPMVTPPSSPPVVDDFVPPRSPTPEIVNPAVLLPASPEVTRLQSSNDFGRLTPRTAAAVGFSQIAPVDLSWDLDEEQISPALRRTQTPANKTMLPPPLPSISKNSVPDTSSPLNPSVSAHLASAVSTPVLPTQPIRRLGLGRPRARPPPVIVSSESRPSASGSPFQGIRPPGSSSAIAVPSSEPDSPVVAMNRLRRRVEVESSSPAMEEPQRRAGGAARRGGAIGDGARSNRRGRVGGGGQRRRRGQLGAGNEQLDMDAELSGSDSGDSSEHSSSSRASSSDLRFADDFAPTQAPRGYNQQAAYRMGLGTQARGHGLHFRRDAHDARTEWLAKARKAVLLTDDESDGDGGGGGGRRGGRGDSSENEYELGSFVVDDDDVL
ncbi:hypothetical protein I317_00481 [Kwoniella heveanensis CBS 569]|nr:hypothetical protein I317_00481 [Kwoniella heveanensis CBS 569]